MVYLINSVWQSWRSIPQGHYLHVNTNKCLSVTFHFRLFLWILRRKTMTPSVKRFPIARITLTKQSQSPNQKWELQPWFPCVTHDTCVHVSCVLFLCSSIRQHWLCVICHFYAAVPDGRCPGFSHSAFLRRNLGFTGRKRERSLQNSLHFGKKSKGT